MSKKVTGKVKSKITMDRKENGPTFFYLYCCNIVSVTFTNFLFLGCSNSRTYNKSEKVKESKKERYMLPDVNQMTNEITNLSFVE